MDSIENLLIFPKHQGLARTKWEKKYLTFLFETNGATRPLPGLSGLESESGLVVGLLFPLVCLNTRAQTETSRRDGKKGSREGVIHEEIERYTTYAAFWRRRMVDDPFRRISLCLLSLSSVFQSCPPCPFVERPSVQTAKSNLPNPTPPPP